MKGRALLLLLSLLLTGTAIAEEEGNTLAEIRFAGNKVTQEKILLQEMVIHVGDAIDTERIERSRQAIMNLGLFKSVTATVEEGNVLLITVEERYYILPFPLLDARPEGNYSYGAEMRFDNIAGLNQHLKITYEEKDSVGSDVPHSKESSITYSYPRLGGSAYQLDFASRLKRWQFPWPDKFAPQAHYGIDNWNTSLGVSRWGNDEGISRGWRFGGGISHQINDYTLLDGTATDTLIDRKAVSLYTTLDHIDVDDHAFYREGRNFGYRFEFGGPFLGADSTFSREQIYLRDYHHLSTGANINSQWQFGFANGCALSCSAWGLGSGAMLRGYTGDYVTGNVFALMNLEYHHPLSGFNQLRGVVFTDVGDAWADMESITFNHLKSSVGVGLRWTVQSFVDVTLRGDFAYALDTQSYRGYFSTRASF